MAVENDYLNTLLDFLGVCLCIYLKNRPLTILIVSFFYMLVYLERYIYLKITIFKPLPH